MYKVLSTFRNNRKEYKKDSLIDGKGLKDLKFLMGKGLLEEVKQSAPALEEEKPKKKAKKKVSKKKEDESE